MANPQAENGHVDIAHEIIEALARYRIPGEAHQCLYVVFRKTYGWKKTEDEISLSQFAAMTGLSRSSTVRAIKWLVTKKILLCYKEVTTYANKYKFNKDFDKWENSYKKDTTKKVTGVTKKELEVVTIKQIVPVTLLSHTKENSTKETSKETPKTLPPKKQDGPSRAGSELPCQENTLGQPKYSEKFELFWMAYPTRDGTRGSKQEAWVEFSAFSEKIQGEIVVAAKNYAATNPKFGVTDAVRFIVKGKNKKKIHPFVEYVESVKTKSSEDRVNEIRKLLERDK